MNAFKFLTKGFKINKEYEIIFNVNIKDYLAIYRVKKDDKLFLLKVYSLSQVPNNFFASNDIPFEISILKEVSHESIPNIIDYGEFSNSSDHFFFIVINMINGEPLIDKLNRDGFFGYYKALPIITQLLEILNYLHSLPTPIIHNNINPNTVWLDYSGGTEKVVLDGFIFARTMQDSRKSISISDLDLNYIAPELFNKIFLPQSDLFSVGALLFRLLCGLPPYYIQINTVLTFSDLLNSKINQWEKGTDLKILADESMDDYQKLIIEKSISVKIENRYDDALSFISHLNREVAMDQLVDNNEMLPPPKQKFKPKKTGTGFDRLAGMFDLKEMIYNDVIRALNEKELYKKYGITIPNGLLLFGPPGCGKTFFAECFAEEIGYNFIYNNPSDVKSKWVNATEEKISALFKSAKENSPTIIYFDEISSLMPSREGDLHQMHSSAVEEFLAQMTNCGEHGIFVLASTNYPEKIDVALLRSGRIDKKYYLPPPDLKAREGIFEIYLKDRPIDLAVDYEKLAMLTEYYVSSDIKFIVDESSRVALKTNQKITMQVLLDVISITSPSVSKQTLDRYELISSHFQKHKNSDEIPKFKIGF